MTEKGGALRHNSNKTPYHMIPIRLLYDHYRSRCEINVKYTQELYILERLASFQEGNGEALRHALAATATSNGARPLEGAARVFLRASELGKYPLWNWALGQPWSIPLACAVRHLVSVLHGEATDPESGMLHMWHAEANLVMLSLYQYNYRAGDDRPGWLLFTVDLNEPATDTGD